LQRAAEQLPPLFKRHIRRPRLTNILDASTAQAIAIVAPAGYGKTTLAAEWLQGRDASIWYRAQEASADVATFSMGLAEAIEEVIPRAGARVRQRLRVSEVPNRQARILAELLAEDIETWPKSSWLVVDDYHLVSGSDAVERFVDSLLTLSPIQLLATSRTRPKWASARRLLYGQILEIDRDMLAMTPQEARGVLDPSSDKRLNWILDRAEGWPALVGLASLVTTAEAPVDSVSGALYRYFAEEVLRGKSEPSKRVLLQLACLPQLNESYLSELKIPPDTLNLVMQEQPSVSTDLGGPRRVHPLLREFLIRRFSEEDPVGYEALHAKLISRARDLAEWADAYELALRVNDLETAADITCDAGTSYLEAGRHETLDRWLTRCAPVLASRPDGLLLHAETLLRLGRLNEAYGLACEVIEAFPQCPPVSRAWRLRGRASYWLAENERALREYRASLDLADDHVERQEALWGAFLAAQQLNLESASDYLYEIEQLSSLDPSMRLRLAVGRSVSGQRLGTFRGSHDVMEANAGFLSRTADPETQSSFLAHWAYIEISRARYEHAQELATRAIESARLLRLGLPVHSCLACQALAEGGLRKFGSATRVLAEMKRLQSEDEDPSVQLQTQIVSLKLRISRGSSLEGWSAQSPVDRSEPAAGEFLALQALAASIQGDRATTASLVEHGRALSGTAECILYAQFAELIIELAALSERKASQRLTEGVTAAADRDCLDAFVLAYRGAPILLELAAMSPDVVETTLEVLSRARDHVLAARAGLSPVLTEPLHRVLTRRELEVFRLVSEGLSNAEIAERLVVSHSTAKVHVHNIIKKLGARNRMDAILRFGSTES
jgi:LuxR family transcriptional regulator, maltose regulon positive regulatory protein